ncbi:oligosaccharide flippase family protein [Marinobacter bryozoorum]|uniref:oligosaccharide flippase family protein n=1 Tax=Marinobacter bryozoorum TaxID=256324 RepID=UPI002004340A|nr:oligosaccharide flippase family protein [Marinobacter bryozoorum]MCK7544032.1 oligosaccharide flippase family protein [Marinobacter bryozoorum]
MAALSEMRKAVIFSSLSKYSVMLITLVTTMVVARLLTPDEIGTFAVASAVVMLVSEFRILGAGVYLVREEDLTRSKVRSALGLTIIISWGLGIVVCLSAPWIARFYDLPEIKTIFWILAVSFFLAPYISVSSALLARHLQFHLILRMQVAGTLVNLAVIVSLIQFGASFYALAWGLSAGALTRFLVAVFFLSPEQMTYRPQFRGLKAIASVGIYSSLTNILRKFTVVAPDLVIGKLGTTYQVSIFSRGLGFVQFVAESLMTSVSPVALPYLSRTRREGGDLSDAYQRATVLLGGLLWPVLAVASLASLPAIRLFFGSQWDAAAPLAGWLALWAALRSVHWFSNQVLLAMHRERVMVLKEAGIFAILLAGIAFAYSGGLERIAQVFVLAGMLEVVVITLVLRKYLGMDSGGFVRAWVSNAAIAGLCALVALGVRQVIDFEQAPPWQPAVALVLVMPPVWLGLLWAFRHPLFDEFAGVLGTLRRKGE